MSNAGPSQHKLDDKPRADHGALPSQSASHCSVEPTQSQTEDTTHPGGNLDAIQRRSISCTRRLAARKAAGTGPCRASTPIFLHICGKRRKSRWQSIRVTPKSSTWGGYGGRGREGAVGEMGKVLR